MAHAIDSIQWQLSRFLKISDTHYICVQIHIWTTVHILERPLVVLKYTGLTLFFGIQFSNQAEDPLTHLLSFQPIWLAFKRRGSSSNNEMLVIMINYSPIGTSKQMLVTVWLLVSLFCVWFADFTLISGVHCEKWAWGYTWGMGWPEAWGCTWGMGCTWGLGLHVRHELYLRLGMGLQVRNGKHVKYLIDARYVDAREVWASREAWRCTWKIGYTWDICITWRKVGTWGRRLHVMHGAAHETWATGET